MIAIRMKRPARKGLSLLEVLVALAIFLFALIGLGQLVTLSGDRAVDVQWQSEAAQLCQSKMAEVVSGITPLSSQAEIVFDEMPEWSWSLTAEADSITGLYRAQVIVSRPRPDGSRFESSMSQLVLDPSIRGSNADSPITETGTDAAGTQSSTTGTATTSSTPAGTSPAAATPQPAAAPAGGGGGGQVGGGGGGGGAGGGGGGGAGGGQPRGGR